MTTAEMIQIAGFLLVILTIVYKAGKIESKFEGLIEKVESNSTKISEVVEVQGGHTANLAALNQATGVYAK